MAFFAQFLESLSDDAKGDLSTVLEGERMLTNGIKDFDRSAILPTVGISVIIGLIAWQSNGGTLAICFAAGFPLGVFTFWLILSFGAGAESYKAKRRRQQSRSPSDPTEVTRFPYSALADTAAMPVHVAKLEKDRIPYAAMEFPPNENGIEFVTIDDLRHIAAPGRDRQTLVFKDTDPNYVAPDEYAPFETTKPGEKPEFDFN